MKERVEVIPANRFGVHCIAVWAPQPIFMPEENATTPVAPAPEAKSDFLELFFAAYAPASPENVTDFFTTKEIKRLIQEHTGDHCSTGELYKKLKEAGFKDVLHDDELVWMAMKTVPVLSDSV